MMYSSPVCLTLRNNKSMDVTSSVIFSAPRFASSDFRVAVAAAVAVY